MNWNNGINKSKFNKTQKEMVRKYRENGMTEEKIRIIQQFDLEVYNSDRRFAEHTQAIISNDNFDGETKNPLLKVFSEKLLEKQKYEQQENSLNWLDEISNPVLVKAIYSLSAEDREILRLIAVNGYTHKEIGELLHTSRQCITSKVQKIRKYLMPYINENGGKK